MKMITRLFVFAATVAMATGETKEQNKESEKSDKAKFSYGSGAIISPKGLILTCAHVVKRGKSLKVYHNNCSHEAELLEIIDDRGQDLALLRCPSLQGKPHFTIRPSGVMKPGDTVFAMGFPEARVLGKEMKITKGEISSKTGYKNDSNIWQTSADIHPGSSGGPFVDEWGRLVGVANSYIPEERIGYCTKDQLLLDKGEAYLGEMKITAPESIPPRGSGLGWKLWHLIVHRGDTKKTMSQIRETSHDKVVIVCVE